MVNLTQQFIGENLFGKSGSLSIFTSLKHFDAFKVQFSGLHFYTFIKDIDSIQGHAAQNCKSGNIVKQAFKGEASPSI